MKKISLFVACCLCFVGCKKAQGTQGVSTECGTSCDTLHYYWDGGDFGAVLTLLNQGGTYSGYYRSNTDLFDDAREGYMPGYFCLPVRNLKVDNTHISFSLNPEGYCFVNKPIDLSIMNYSTRLPEGYSEWLQTSSYFWKEVAFEGAFSTDSIALTNISSYSRYTMKFERKDADFVCRRYDYSQVADSIHYMNSKEYRASGKAPRIDYAPIEAASNLVKPFYCSEREHSFVLEKSQSVKAGKSRDAIVRWYRDEKEWEVQDSTYSKIEILQDDSLLAGYINDNGWVKLSEYPMNDSVTVLLLEERTYSAGSPSLCLLKLENRSVSVLYNQEQFINHIAEKAGSLELTLFGFVHDYRHYKLNASHPILMGPHVKMNIDRNGIKLFDSEGHETSISLQHQN